MGILLFAIGQTSRCFHVAIVDIIKYHFLLYVYVVYASRLRHILKIFSFIDTRHRSLVATAAYD